MKNMLKKNQIMITALAIMIAVAGYLNFAGTKVTEEEIMTVDSDTVVNDEINLTDSTDITPNSADTDVAALLDISDEDLEQASYGDIESLDSEVDVAAADYMDEGMAESVSEGTAGDAAAASDAAAAQSDVPGEAVFTSTAGAASLSGAKLQKEQTRAKNKETLLEIINNANITESQKQEAVDSMIAITGIAEKETAAEILLEAKGFNDVVVSISDTGVDVVVNAAELSEAQRAQIEDIITRKTGAAPETIIISTMAAQ